MKKISLLIITALALATGKIAQAAEWTPTGLDASAITVIGTTPFGILAGELDNRIWLDPPPFNGVYISKDLGETWTKLGLEQAGIKDLAYAAGNIYAATFYNNHNPERPAGGYISKDGGGTWEFLGKAVNSTKIAANDTTVFLGSENRGLWVSHNDGLSWEQKIGNGADGTKIYAIYVNRAFVLASTSNKVYQSIDTGSTWSEISYFDGKRIEGFLVYEDIIYAQPGGETSFYVSHNNGNSWEKSSSLDTHYVTSFTQQGGALFAGVMNLYETTRKVYSSTNLGTSWENTGLETYKNIVDFSTVASKPNLVLALALREHLYKYSNVPNLVTFPFLEIPWETNQNGDFVNKIYSFFDHEYPLLGYGYHKEPLETQNTTLNYLGIRGTEPEMYYSSHDGYDYALPYGTPIIAPATGYAYYYWCSPCGHAIKIDHQNGYQTTYMHLQATGLITTSETQPLWINQGEQLGLVGMTGNTTGPHLHFSVERSDINPGKIDPYGWQNRDFPDPWELYTWQDQLGTHRGVKSSYLWKFPLPQTSQHLSSGTNTIVIDNKTIEMESLDVPATATLEPQGVPATNQPQLTYIPQTATLITAIDYLGNKIATLKNPVKLILDISNVDLSNIAVETLKLYFRNETTHLWEELPTIVDLIAKKLIGETYHFSNFAAFGEKLDSDPPTTTLTIQGQKQNGWFTEHPTFILETENPADKIFYALDDETWEEYTTPFETILEGIFTIKYRSMDDVENIEPVNTYTLKVDAKEKFKKRVTIRESLFQTVN